MKLRLALMPVCLGFSMAVCFMPLPATAQITLDGSVGPSGALSGPDYAITANLGRQVGGNLFHSFGTFNVDQGESATFSGPASVDNVIARVSGGSQSNINGLLRSTIPDANLFLLNPAGIVFGANARLDVGGAFHASTASYLDLSGGGIIYADTSEASTLTSAPPSAFGFLDRATYGTISNSAILEVSKGETISLVGGDLYQYRGSLYAPGGVINLTAAASPGEVVFNGTSLSENTFSILGDITLRGDYGEYRNIGSGFYHAIGTVDVCGAANPGSIFMRSGSMTLRASKIESSNYYCSLPGQVIDIRVTDDLNLRLNGSIIAEAINAPGGGSRIVIEAGALNLGQADEDFYTGSIRSSTTGWSSGKGGDISIKADSLAIGNYYYIDDATFYRSGIVSESNGSSRAGDIRIEAGALRISDLGEIRSSAMQAGRGGDIALITTTIDVEGQIYGRYASQILSEAESSGRGGDISFQTGTLTLADSGLIRSSRTNGIGSDGEFWNGSGRGGDIRIEAGSIVVKGMNTYQDSDADQIIRSAISTETASPDSRGRAGDLTIKTGTLTVAKGGTIVSICSDTDPNDDMFTFGGAGNIVIDAGAITVTGAGYLDGYSASNISSETVGMANAGNVMIHTGSLTLADAGRIETNAWQGSMGNAGDIAISADSITVSGYRQGQGLFPQVYRSGITSESFSRGKPGNIDIDSGSLTVTEAGVISTSTARTGDSHTSVGDAGSIDIKATDLAISGYYDNGHEVYQSAILSDSWGYGNAGLITINADRLRLSDLGTIRTNVWGNEGKGGDIRITGGLVSIADAAQTSAGRLTSSISSEAWAAGNAGNIMIDAKSVQLSQEGVISTDTHSTGSGGTISVSSDTLTASGGAVVSSASAGSGNAGNIALTATDSITLQGSAFTTQTSMADGGNIEIEAGRILHLDHSPITTSVQGGTGSGGNIFIDSHYVILDNSRIIAQAVGGNGGQIHIQAGTFIQDPASVISASSALGIDGDVTVDAPSTDVVGAMAILPSAFLAEVNLAGSNCAARTAENSSSLTLEGSDTPLPGEDAERLALKPVDGQRENSGKRH